MKLDEMEKKLAKRTLYLLYDNNIISRLNLKQALGKLEGDKHPENLNEYFEAEIAKTIDIRRR